VKQQLSEESQERLEKNPLRILDSARTRATSRFWPMRPRSTRSCRRRRSAFFAAVTSGLDAAGVKWVRAEPAWCAGLDYYRHTAFEFIPDEGSASAAALGAEHGAGRRAL
jgi:histidyl-tRNA synthetase